jgi:hypothetical protein
MHKAGDVSNLANYTPLNLLDTGYCILAKVLVNRLAGHLPEVIGPEQIAFIKSQYWRGNPLVAVVASPPSERRAVGAWFSAIFTRPTIRWTASIMEHLRAGPDLVNWDRLLYATHGLSC